jgi:hypothetical protein
MMGRIADLEFKTGLRDLIRRVEAWSYADSDAGAGVPVELADALAVLTLRAPSAALRRGLRRAQDALDDGLPAEALAAELYRIRDQLSDGPKESGPASPSR